MAAYKPWRDKDWLYRKYVGERKTLAQIVADAKELGHSVTEMTIYNNLKGFNIPIRGGGRNLGKRSVGGSDSKRRRGGFY
jgi:hypothetical protein